MRILIFDTETGGTNPYYNDILQLSYQIIDGETFHVVREANYYFPWPEDKRRVQWGAIQVNGLTEEFLATQDLYDRYEVLNDFIDELIESTFVLRTMVTSIKDSSMQQPGEKEFIPFNGHR